MLEKLRLFNKEKSTSSNTSSSSKSQVSKRTSSSSGFSSARSERSDSSLSLNDGHASQIKPSLATAPTANNRSTKDQSSKSTKQSKLLSGSQKVPSKETIASKASGKQEKKEKSPARKENDVQVGDSKLAQISGKSQKVVAPTIKSDSKSKPSSKLVSNKLEMRSESKSSLVSPPKTTLMTTTSTGIPKPMAAIKGTSKSTPFTERRMEMHDIKSEKNDISNNHNSISEANLDQRMHIVNPISIIDNSNLLPNGPIGHMSKLLQQTNSISMSDSLHSGSTQSGLHSNSSESSVIYKPSSESGSDSHYTNSRIPPPSKNPIPNRKLDFRGPMMDTANETNSSGNKFHTVPSKIVGTIYEEEKPVNVMPMRPLLRGYNSHVTLPTRGTRGQHYVTDFCESDIGQGYCSDGDALRRGPPSRYNDIDNGYMSEGSGGMHGKHFLSVMRTRSHLPTTIEERYVPNFIRNYQDHYHIFQFFIFLNVSLTLTPFISLHLTGN